MEDRMSRLELKIDKLTEAIITLAAIQERMEGVIERTAKNENQIIMLWENQRNLSDKVSSIAPLANGNNKSIWFIATSVVAVMSAAAGGLVSAITSFFTK